MTQKHRDAQNLDGQILDVTKADPKARSPNAEHETWIVKIKGFGINFWYEHNKSRPKTEE